MSALFARHSLWLILAAALAVRSAAAVGVTAYLERSGREFLIPGDADGYWTLAGKLAAGEEYAVYDPPRRVMRMPGFPLLLAGVRTAFGPSLLAARLTLAGVATAGVWAVYLLGRTLDGERTGLIAATLCAAWPVLAGFGVLILSETTFAVLVTFSLWATARLAKGGGAGWAAAAGGLVAAASFVRPTWLPAAGLIPLAYWLTAGRTRAAAFRAAVVAGVAAAAFVPWTVRNWQVTGHLVPTTLWVGPSLYDGLGPQATGESDMRFFEIDDLMQRMSEYDMDREYRRRAWAFARENPGRAAWLSVVKLWRYFQPWPGAEQFGSWPARVVVAGFSLPALALAAAGAWVRRGDVWLLALTAGPLLLFAAVHSLFVGSLRYRLPAEYPLCVLAAVGLRTAWMSGRPSRSLGSGRGE